MLVAKMLVAKMLVAKMLVAKMLVAKTLCGKDNSLDSESRSSAHPLNSCATTISSHAKACARSYAVVLHYLRSPLS